MNVKNAGTGEVLVGRDPSGSFIELQTAGGEILHQPRGVLLTRDEARRLAAIILLEAGKLDASPEAGPLDATDSDDGSTPDPQSAKIAALTGRRYLSLVG